MELESEKKKGGLLTEFSVREGYDVMIGRQRQNVATQGDSFSIIHVAHPHPHPHKTLPFLFLFTPRARSSPLLTDVSKFGFV